mmetsp:Transcript_103220/g.205146  ORF Transcript_103220/g.205146 Transcript_103220/m.205146 type:complete len:945 (-) Transcript_103220:52-2886(-)
MTSKHVRARVQSEGQPLPLPSGGVLTNFSNEQCDGSVFFVHRPQADVHDLLHAFGANYCFELQICCRFKTKPQGILWLLAELRDGPMRLNLVTRALCRVLLAFIQKQAARRGMEFRYSFGDAKTSPQIAVPVSAADRIVISNESLPLPVIAEADRGCWHVANGKHTPIDRNTLSPEEGQYMTVMFATSFIDLNKWVLTNIPGVGNLELSQFWGVQPLYVSFHDQENGIGTKRVYYDMVLASVDEQDVDVETVLPDAARQKVKLPVSSGEDAKETVIDWADAVVEEEPQNLATADEMQHSSSFCNSDEDGDSEDGKGDTSSDELEEARPGDEKWEVQSKISAHSKGIMDLLNQPEQTAPTLMELDADASRVGSKSTSSVMIPWYFINGAGELWWCIVFQGQVCWRHHSHLCALCSALGAETFPVTARSSVQHLEACRRVATRLLTQGCNAPGLLEEFTCAAVDLTSLLSGEVRPKKQAMFVGIVEAEGRIVERFVKIHGETLRWSIHHKRRRKRFVCIDLKRVDPADVSVSGAEAILISTMQKSHMLVARDATHRELIKDSIRNLAIDNAGDNGTYLTAGNAATAWSALTPVAELWSVARRRIAHGVARVPGTSLAQTTATSVHQRASEKMLIAASVLQRAVPPQARKDPLRRWPKSRIVINDTELFLDDKTSARPLELSAELLKCAVAAQGTREDVVRTLTSHSNRLKRVDLCGLGPQSLWGFWVNVFHILLIHAQLVLGKPRSLQNIVSFFNNCSYIVAGHVFSLAEIEHCILRKNMTKPRVRLVRSFLRIWPRTDEDMEMRPCLSAPSCPASCFGCRQDWRLNLVLNAGNSGCAEAIPVFEPMDKATFDALVNSAVQQTLADCAVISRDSIELPYSLCRYRDDAPPGGQQEPHERRWARALFPQAAEAAKVGYCRTYTWSMRDRLELLGGNSRPNNPCFERE